MEKQGKLVDNQARMAIERMKIEAQLAVAEVQTKAQQLSERAGFINDLYAQLHQQDHEARQAAMDRYHQQTMQQQDIAHEQTMQAGDAAHEYAMQQMAPQPETNGQPASP
jgi:hypothetical protein